ncbi:MAG: tetratricopeptide repeat protein [Planctomycetota bacterium]|nr:tetratricopeptide repeat protein [Planctomycetota bacterium]
MGSIDGQSFLATVRPLLATGDAQTLAHAVEANWKPAAVCGLLCDPDIDVRRVAAVVLGLMGDRAAVPCLARALHDVDAVVNEMAEFGLMSILFRSGDPEAVPSFREGVALLNDECYAAAIERFELSTQIDPDFAEAYNQCSLAQYLLGHWQDAIDDARRTTRRVPQHFGAVAGMGHAYVQMCDFDQALKCYKQALSINPRMPAIARVIETIDERLRRRNDSSGMFEFQTLGV